VIVPPGDTAHATLHHVVAEAGLVVVGSLIPFAVSRDRVILERRAMHVLTAGRTKTATLVGVAAVRDFEAHPCGTTPIGVIRRFLFDHRFL
jgi:hypothetical protein